MSEQQLSEPWAVGEYWSSSRPHRKVQVLSVGENGILIDGAHHSFIRWICKSEQLEELESKVIAQQARIEQLRDALSAFPYGQHAMSGGKECSCSVCEAMRGKVKALSTTDDLSALRAHDEKLLATNTQAAKDVLAERERQKSVEGWTPEHDDQHRKGALAAAGGCYALFADYYLAEGHPPEFWPWDAKWWKPSLARRNLIKAGALILAEIERFDRAEAIEKGGESKSDCHGPDWTDRDGEYLK